MLHESYVHEMLARAAGRQSKQELARRLVQSELSQQGGWARRAARKSGWLLIRLGTWLFAYGGGRDGRLRLSDLPTYTRTTTFSQN